MPWIASAKLCRSILRSPIADHENAGNGLEASSAEADDESGMHAWKRASLMAQGVGMHVQNCCRP